MTSKEAVRQACKSRRTALSVDDSAVWTEQLTYHITSLASYRQAERIMAYLAMPKEANLDKLIEYALKDGKDVYVPVCIDRTTMIAVRLHSLEAVERGLLGIRVPKEPYEVLDAKDLDLILVPGLGFDHLGGRMGMGNGYYDRFLAELSPTSYIGVAWSMQVLDMPIPMEEHDCRMVMVVTEQGVIHM